MQLMREALGRWLLIALLAGAIFVVVFFASQYYYRQGIHDPQAKMAEEAALQLAGGDVPASVVPRAELFDMSEKVSPWIAVYDASFMPLEANAYVNGEPPRPPSDFFLRARDGQGTGSLNPHEYRSVWHPDPAGQQALVVVAVPDTDPALYVAAGRSLREVEEGESRVAFALSLILVFFLGITFITELGAGMIIRRM